MNIVAIVQARTGSQRLPNKVMLEIQNTTVIHLLLQRLTRSKLISQIVVATTTNSQDIALVQHVEKYGFSCFCGSERDVLGRYYEAAKMAQADVIVRITGDCPFVDHRLVDQAIETFQANQCDYLSNINPPTYPDGLDVEVFSFSTLEMAHKEAFSQYDREHVTPYIKGSNNQYNISHSSDHSSLRWTLDEQEDFSVISNVFSHFHPNIDFSWQEILKLEHNQPELFSKNKNISRNSGETINSGQKLWKRAKNVIPGGNMLLSKRPEMHLPDIWPTYFSSAKGCQVTDLDGIEYTDMSLMGVGTNLLGYANQDIDDAVISALRNSNMSTLNAPEEVYLAEKLIAMHPFAEMVKFARSGGEANAIAIRIARAASGKDKVAFCGYHGWHDWYLSANLENTNSLGEHLLPGLSACGVPQNLEGSVIPFSYNNFEELSKIVATNDIGVIKMEVSRNYAPKNDFLKKVRDLASSKGIVLIFDECTSGFRETFGGLHKKYDVEPDMAVFGKALGNGYAITAVIGNRNVMESAQSTFISSTFWTERSGSVAALKTLEMMEQTRSWQYITDLGLSIRKRLTEMAASHHLSLSISGLAPLTSFSFKSKYSLEYKTLVAQEMLKKGYLAGTNIYLSTAHTDNIIDSYLSDLNDVFALIKQCEEQDGPEQLLVSSPCHQTFKRLN